MEIVVIYALVGILTALALDWLGWIDEEPDLVPQKRFLLCFTALFWPVIWLSATYGLLRGLFGVN